MLDCQDGTVIMIWRFASQCHACRGLRKGFPPLPH